MTERDPLRLSEPGSGAPDELRALFDAGARDLPNQVQLDRLASKLGPLLAAPAGGGPGPGEAPGSGGSAIGLGKLGAVAAALIGGAVLVSSLNKEVPETVPDARPLPTEQRAPDPNDAPKAPPSVAVEAPSVEAPNAAPSAAERPAPRAERRSSAELEVELLERARAALAPNPGHALSLTSEHKLRFPGGALAQEREVIAIEALKRLGRSDQAARRADEFAKHYPGSAHRHKLDAGVTR